jgi:hypothetical protein
MFFCRHFVHDEDNFLLFITDGIAMNKSISQWYKETGSHARTYASSIACFRTYVGHDLAYSLHDSFHGRASHRLVSLKRRRC